MASNALSSAELPPEPTLPLLFPSLAASSNSFRTLSLFFLKQRNIYKQRIYSDFLLLFLLTIVCNNMQELFSQEFSDEAFCSGVNGSFNRNSLREIQLEQGQAHSELFHGQIMPIFNIITRHMHKQCVQFISATRLYVCFHS